MSGYAHSLDGMEVSLAPENEGIYRTKPLPSPPPAPPIPSKSSARPSVRLSLFPSAARRGNSVEDLTPTIQPMALPHRSTTSLPGTPFAEHRRSLKVQQLTGQVGLCFDWSPTRGFSPVASPVLIRDDSSSNYSQSMDELALEDEYVNMPKCSECCMPPLLEDEDDNDGTTSNRSSTGPKSPQPLLHSTSSMKRASSIYSNTPSIVEPIVDIDDDQFDTDSDSWHMSQSYSHFSDTETADEYHRITSNLALLDKQQRGRNLSPGLARSRSLTSRLSSTAKSLFHRRREPPRSVCSAHGSFAGGDRPDKSALSPPSPNPPQDAMSTPSGSVFETSDDEESELEEGPMRDLKEFFSRRSEERGPPKTGSVLIPRSVPHQQAEMLGASPQLKTTPFADDMLSNAKLMSKAERRQHQLRAQINIIPEEALSR